MVGENIVAVKELLHSIGFDSGLEQALRAKACYLPALFEVDYTLARESDSCLFLFHIKNESGIYACTYYDACYKKEIVIDDAAAASLETRMRLIDWHALPTFATFDDIESIVTDLLLLDKVQAGLLMYKYWMHTPLEANITGIAALRAQYEISQRFYITAGAKPISMDEAYRFLQSQWLAKQARRRAAPKQTEVKHKRKAKR